MTLVLPQNTDDTALNLDITGGNHDRSHFGIGGLETNLARPFAVEALQWGFFATHEGHNDIAGIRHLCLFADDIVAIHDVVFNHGGPFHLQHEGVSTPCKIP